MRDPACGDVGTASSVRGASGVTGTKTRFGSVPDSRRPAPTTLEVTAPADVEVSGRGL